MDTSPEEFDNIHLVRVTTHQENGHLAAPSNQVTYQNSSARGNYGGILGNGVLNQNCIIIENDGILDIGVTPANDGHDNHSNARTSGIVNYGATEENHVIPHTSVVTRIGNNRGHGDFPGSGDIPGKSVASGNEGNEGNEGNDVIYKSGEIPGIGDVPGNGDIPGNTVASGTEVISSNGNVSGNSGVAPRNGTIPRNGAVLQTGDHPEIEAIDELSTPQADAAPSAAVRNVAEGGVVTMADLPGHAVPVTPPRHDVLHFLAIACCFFAALFSLVVFMLLIYGDEGTRVR